MNAIQIVRESAQFPQMERISENQVNFYFDQSSRPYGKGTQYMAVMVTVDTESDDLDEIKALALESIREYRIKQIEEYDKSDNVNDLIYYGRHMWFDKMTRATISYSMECEKRAGAETTVLIAPSGEKYTLNIDTAIGLFAQLEVYAKQCFNITETHKATVASLEDADAILGYDYKAGYPRKLMV